MRVYVRPRRRLYRFLQSATARLSYWFWRKGHLLPLTPKEEEHRTKDWIEFQDRMGWTDEEKENITNESN